MWETIVELVKSGDAWLVLAILALMAFAIRQGYMKVRTEKILIGKDSSERERLLMKKQSEFAHAAAIAFEKEFPHFDGYNNVLGELIAEKAYDEIVNWIMINHIEDDKVYIANKQQIIWNIVTAEFINEKMRNKKNKEMIYQRVEEIIKELAAMREKDMSERKYK